MNNIAGINGYNGEEIIRVDDEFEDSKHLIVAEEKGLFKPHDTFWLDEYVVKEWQAGTPGNFRLELTTDKGAVHLVKGVSSSKKGAYITATSDTLKRLGLQIGSMVFVRPVNS